MTASDVRWLPVTTLAWYAPNAVVTVIIRVTHRLGADGAFHLSTPSAPRTRSSLAGRLADVVPRKPRVDLLLSGHALSPTPRAEIHVEVSTGSYRRALTAVAPRPTVAIALEGADLRDRASGTAAFVGARAEFDPRAGLRLSRTDFDFGVFQAAAPEQQLLAFPHGAPLELRGLSRLADVTIVRLPVLRPRVFARLETGDIVEPELACDTVVLDTEGPTLRLTYRGVIEVRALSGVVGLVDDGRGGALDAASRALPPALAPRADVPSIDDALVTEEERTHVLEGSEDAILELDGPPPPPSRRGRP